MSSARLDVADVFRDEWPRLVARLVRDVGDVGLAEDAAQEAFVEAARRWPERGSPDVPAAWLLTTARRKAIDQLRRSKRLTDRLADLVVVEDGASVADGAETPGDLVDDQLALLLGCCHPALSFDAQVALTLRIVAGLSSAQIARAFFVSESTMTRRLTRSKSKIRATNLAFTRPDVATLHERLPAVSAIIYSIFTEGHASANAPTLVRGDLCDEAIWLGTLVHQLVPDDPEVSGLLALMLLIDARRATRTDEHGVPVRLAAQDRTGWDAAQISTGITTLANAYGARRGGPYQFQAAIAALHATAATFDDTDWAAIVRLYEVLLARQPSAVLGLNHAVAVSQRDGMAAGLRALELIERHEPFAEELADYPYFHSARGEMLAALNRSSEAVSAFDQALAACTNEAERTHLAVRIRELSPPNE